MTDHTLTYEDFSSEVFADWQSFITFIMLTTVHSGLLLA